MPTKLSRYSERVMEATWLAVVIVLPIFFNVYSSRIFEPDKIALLRSLTLVILGAWIVKIVDSGDLNRDSFWPNRTSWKKLLKTPLVAPVLATAAVYLIATIFSITPRVSLLGSYQRLQGTYTTLSYLIIFAAIAVNLRKRSQVERFISFLIITSLPVSLYGILQKYSLDPIPWGGDTTIRIASMMGNSIFVAAYLIMVFPLTLGRIVESFRSIMSESNNMVAHIVRAAIYIFLSIIQVMALYLSGSRGPVLGWIIGLFFIILMLTVFWRKKWATISIVVVSLAIGLFLMVFNVENGPFEKLRSSPAIGRFGLLLNAESNSALVRRYIWEGAADLVAPHSPLDYPDGKKDIVNFLRPIVGYGPESMFVAFNRFYIPQLGIVERRNATPDRSHNETWDTLVITGILGLATYLFIYSTVFYYGLVWLGLITNRRRKILFWTFFIAGGLIGAVGFSMWRGFEYIGVGLPFGIILGLVGYIILAAIGSHFDPPNNPAQLTRLITLLVLLAAIISHFVEINFGIAIAVTRTYFWIYAALLLCIGYILPQIGEYGHNITQVNGNYSSTQDPATRSTYVTRQVGTGTKTRKKNQQKQRQKVENRPGRIRGVIGSDRNRDWLSEAIVAGIMLAMVIATIGFDLISYSSNSKTSLGILWYSFTALRNTQIPSYGILAMVIITWLLSALLLASEASLSEKRDDIQERIAPSRNIAKLFGVILGVSFLLGLFYCLWQSGALASITRFGPQTLDELLRQVERFAGLLSRYYIYIFFSIFLSAWFLSPSRPARMTSVTAWGGVVGVLALIIIVCLSIYTNLRVIQADITFKLADQFTKQGSWPVAIEIYNKANKLAPNEDYYYLFLGRAYFEQAKGINDSIQRDGLLEKAARDLKKAQIINPLNTDHTANLARLYSLWAGYTEDPVKRQELVSLSDGYFEKALSLSPKNVRLWNEWAFLILEEMDDPEKAYQLLQTALQLDSTYSWTYGLIGDYYFRKAVGLNDSVEQQSTLELAKEYYKKALGMPGDNQTKYRIALSLGDLALQTNQPLEAIDAYQQALSAIASTPEGWKIEETLARLYFQIGDLENSIIHANKALELAPEDQHNRIQELINQIAGQAR